MNPQIQVQGFMSMRLCRKHELAEGIWLFEFERPGGGSLPGYAPGAHVTLVTPSGARRNYSLCSDPRDTEVYQLGIKIEPKGRGASVSMIERTRVGDLVQVSAPDNSFPLVEAPEYLLIAGGIGITPLMSMVRHLRRTGTSRFRLIYLTRSRAQTAFIDELESQDYGGQVEIHHDNGDPESLYDFWPLFEQPRKCHVYCCGPRPLMEEIRAVSGHWPSELIHFEDFASDVQSLREGDRSFIVRHADTGETVQIPHDSTILETLRSRGYELPSSCESGTCGTCRTQLVEGEADHRDMVLEEHQRGDCIMICVSRARSSELVLRW
jgi:phthalate 4,5-dioxygenase reductase component